MVERGDEQSEMIRSSEQGMFNKLFVEVSGPEIQKEEEETLGGRTNHGRKIARYERSSSHTRERKRGRNYLNCLGHRMPGSMLVFL